MFHFGGTCHIGSLAAILSVSVRSRSSLFAVAAVCAVTVAPISAGKPTAPRSRPLVFAPAPAPAPQWQERDSVFNYEFYYTRGIYSGGRYGGFRGGGGSWATDYPKSDRQFLVG